MSLKAELLRWAQALDCYDAQDYSNALNHFEVIADSSKVLFNIGLIHATLGDHDIAVDCYRQANLLDQYLAVSFFQCGVSNFLLGRYNDAQMDFESAEIHMRENQIIDYEQLGLKFRLFSAEILFNKGLALINQGQQIEGMRALDLARKEKQTDEHKVIDEAYNEYGRDFTVFSVPVGILFRPPPIKLKNLKAKNYLGTAKLVAATEQTDAFIGFSGTGPGKGTVSTPLNGGSLTTSRASPIVQPLPITRSRSQSTDTYLVQSTSTGLKSQKSVPDFQNNLPPVPDKDLQFSKDSNVNTISGTTTGLPPFNPRRRPSLPVNTSSLPKLNTNVASELSRTAKNIASLSASPSNYNTLSYITGAGGRAIQDPPTPPDSDSGKQNRFGEKARRVQLRPESSDTALGYMASGPGEWKRPVYGRPQAEETKRGQKGDTSFIEEILDDYSAYEGEDVLNGRQILTSMIPPTPQGQSVDRVKKWAESQSSALSQQKNDLLKPLERITTMSSRVHRNNTQRSARRQKDRCQDRGMSMIDAGSYSGMSIRSVDMINFRLKLHYENDIRGMSLDVDTPYAVFVAKLQAKFGLADLKVKYKDEDGVFVSLLDEDDWNSAVDAAREHCPKDRQDGKLEMWVESG